MEKLSETQILSNIETVTKLIDGFPEWRRKPVKKMFEEIGSEYSLAPASSREEFHGCFPGGLCDHSLRVTRNLRKLSQTLAPGLQPDHVLNFLGLMHDLGKIGDGQKPLYIPNPSDWHRNKGMLYETNKEIDFMPICDRTLYLLQKYQIVLSPEEFVALKISDGMYEESNRKYGMKEPDLALLVHWADRWACSQEKL